MIIHQLVRAWCVAFAAVVLLGATSERPLRIGLVVQPNTLNPLVSAQYIENYIEEAVFSGLLIVDDHGDLQPDLAAVVPTRANGGISADEKTITYHLRRNVTWQDGVPFTARDVAFTFAKIRDPRVPFALGSWYSIVERLTTPDPYTVVVHLNAVDADATAELFVNGEFGMIVPEHILRSVSDLARAPFAGAPIGTGPYRVEHWDRGSSIDLRANPAYFRGAPHIDHIQIRFAGDQNTLAVQKHTGELDFVPNLPLTQISTFRNSPAMTVRMVPTYYLDYLVANTRQAPFDDVRVRRAFALTVDRDALVRTSYHGAAQSADAFVPPFSRFHPPASGRSGRPDAAAARRLLDAAGWRTGPDGIRRKNGIPLAFALTTLAAQTVLLSAAVQLQAAWREIGATVDLRPLQSTLVFGPQGVLARGDYSLAFVNYGELAQPDISDNVASAALPPHGANYAHFVDHDIDRWLHESRTLDNVAARRKVIGLITTRLDESAPQTPVLWESFLYAWSGDLLGVRPETINSDFWNVQDWSWK